MGTHDNAATVRRNYEALNNGDVMPLLESLSPDYRYTCHTRNRFHGQYDTASMLAMLATLPEIQSDFRMDIIDVREVADDMVVLHYRANFAVDGRRVEDADVVAVVVFEDGKIVDAVDVNSARLNRFWQEGGDPRDSLDSL